MSTLKKKKIVLGVTTSYWIQNQIFMDLLSWSNCTFVMKVWSYCCVCNKLLQIIYLFMLLIYPSASMLRVVLSVFHLLFPKSHKKFHRHNNQTKTIVCQDQSPKQDILHEIQKSINVWIEKTIFLRLIKYNEAL